MPDVAETNLPRTFASVCPDLRSGTQMPRRVGRELPAGKRPPQAQGPRSHRIVERRGPVTSSRLRASVPHSALAVKWGSLEPKWGAIPERGNGRPVILKRPRGWPANSDDLLPDPNARPNHSTAGLAGRSVSTMFFGLVPCDLPRPVGTFFGRKEPAFFRDELIRPPGSTVMPNKPGERLEDGPRCKDGGRGPEPRPEGAGVGGIARSGPLDVLRGGAAIRVSLSASVCSGGRPRASPGPTDLSLQTPGEASAQGAEGVFRQIESLSPRLSPPRADPWSAEPARFRPRTPVASGASRIPSVEA